MMITAIPTLGGKIAPESDTVTEYTLVEGSGNDLSMRTVNVASALAVPNIVADLQAQSVQRILAAEMSQEFMLACEMAGIQVFYGASGTVSDALNLISLGILDSMAAGGCGCGGGGCGGGSCDSTNSSCGCEGEKAEASGSCGSGCACGH